MIVRKFRGLMREPGFPPIMASSLAVNECGCGAALGIRLDSEEPAIVTFPCSEEHTDAVTQATAEFRSILDAGDDPEAEALVTIDRLITAALPVSA